jgi:streptogramin lyase
VEWDGTNIWTSSDGDDAIFKLNPTTGATTFTSAAMGAWVYGIAWDGTVFWCTSNNEQSIYRYNPNTNTVAATYSLGSGVSPEGDAFVNGYLYVCTNGTINKCTPSPFNTVAAYRIPGIQAFGIAFDGTKYWVSGTDANYKTLLYKVALQ